MNDNYKITEKQVGRICQALALLHNMIESGEMHSDKSRHRGGEALTILSNLPLLSKENKDPALLRFIEDKLQEWDAAGVPYVVNLKHVNKGVRDVTPGDSPHRVLHDNGAHLLKLEIEVGPHIDYEPKQ